MNRSSPAKARKKVKKIVKATKALPLERLQYAALPWRKTNRLEIMLVSSRETRRWIIPKGWPMAGRSGSAAAGIEAMEEAGLLGVIAKEPIGQYFYEKRFSRYVQACRVEVFPLRVVRQRDDWPEKHERSTKWFAAEEAKELISEPELSELIGMFIRSFAN